MAGSNLPCVIVNIMRAGPGLGGIQPSQSDYFQATRGGGHGDYQCLVYAPTSVQQAVDLTQLAFYKADEYLMPAIILGDGIIGQMMEPVIIPEKKPIPTDKSWATTGWSDKSRKRAVITSLHLNPIELEKMNLDLQAKYKTIKEAEVLYETYNTEDSDILVVAYGSTARTIRSAIDENELKGHKIGLFTPISLWPFPEKELLEAAKGKKAILVVEMSAGQMVEDVRLSVGAAAPIHFYGRIGGVIPTAEEIFEQIVKLGEVM